MPTLENILGFAVDLITDLGTTFINDCNHQIDCNRWKSSKDVRKTGRSSRDYKEKLACLKILDDRGELSPASSKKFNEKFKNTLKFLK